MCSTWEIKQAMQTGSFYTIIDGFEFLHFLQTFASFYYINKFMKGKKLLDEDEDFVRSKS
jgi:hypothetical protein